MGLEPLDGVGRGVGGGAGGGAPAGQHRAGQDSRQNKAGSAGQGKARQHREHAQNQERALYRKGLGTCNRSGCEGAWLAEKENEKNAGKNLETCNRSVGWSNNFRVPPPGGRRICMMIFYTLTCIYIYIYM